MPSHLAPLPSLAFVADLVDAAQRFDEDDYGGVQVGDIVEFFDTGASGVVVAMEGTQGRLRTDAGAEVDFDAGEDFDGYVVDRPSLSQLWEEHLRRRPAEGVARVEGLADGLHERLQAGVDALKAGRVDYHPGSGTTVRDLVHPSLFPLVRSVPPEPPPEPAPTAAKPGWLSWLLGRRGEASPSPAAAPDRWQRPFEGSVYQWLPTRFAIDDAGEVHIEGPINNLPREAHGATYDALAELFAHLLPSFESVCGYVDALDLYGDELEGEHELPEADAEARAPQPAAPRSLRGRTVQVITKIVEYSLAEGETFEGVWHVEGMSHEHILATGVWTLHRDPGLEGGDLRFKRAYTKEEAGALFWNIAQVRPTSIEDIAGEGHVPVGSVATEAGCGFVFPNSHVHKLTTLSPSAQPATRQVIVFWLVDPEVTITGMEDVPLPQSTMTYEEACEVRLALMEERRVHKQSQNVRVVSLCEH